MAIEENKKGLPWHSIRFRGREVAIHFSQFSHVMEPEKSISLSIPKKNVRKKRKIQKNARENKPANYFCFLFSVHPPGLLTAWCPLLLQLSFHCCCSCPFCDHFRRHQVHQENVLCRTSWIIWCEWSTHVAPVTKSWFSPPPKQVPVPPPLLIVAIVIPQCRACSAFVWWIIVRRLIHLRPTQITCTFIHSPVSTISFAKAQIQLKTMIQIFQKGVQTNVCI